MLMEDASRTISLMFHIFLMTISLKMLFWSVEKTLTKNEIEKEIVG
jgi:hypothetical protein